MFGLGERILLVSLGLLFAEIAQEFGWSAVGALGLPLLLVAVFVLAVATLWDGAASGRSRRRRRW